MALQATVNVPISAAELVKMRAEETAENEKRERQAVADRNRARDLPKPSPGTKLYVATARGINNRGRAGLTFSQQPGEVTVVSDDDKTTREKQISGAYVVNEWGAEQILDDANGPDKGLVVFTSKPGDASLATASDDQLEAELARRRAAPAGGGEKRIGATGTTARGAGDFGGETPTEKPAKKH